MTDKTTGRQQSTQSAKSTTKTKKTEAQVPAEPSHREQDLTIVGIGASAGGLAALRSFFTALPAATGMAFVVITHLHPEHESHLAELLQRHTSMPTTQVTRKVRVESNHVYVIPPKRSIRITDTHLETRPYREPIDRRTPIDLFFRSMAKSGRSDLVAIILSGTGTDGSLGIKDVKEGGGLILVQQPEDSEYDGMPRAALSTGLVDIVLPAAQLAQKLSEYMQHRPQLPHDPGQLSDAEVEKLQRILGQVHARTGHDFSQYKRSTVLRRVERRMQLNGFTTLEAYLAYLRGNATEAKAMFNDILIGVTSFFRDRESWQALEQKVIPELFRQKRNGQQAELRVWSIGCATGEEAYGLAMLLFEEADRQDIQPEIEIFASDLDERSIARAREGLYPAAIEADVSPERLERFFTREGEYYRVRRELRDAVLFTSHNVLRDPPFSRQHLIVCRNVLIYLQRGVQERVFDIFHYSLYPRGYLFLGTSESVEYVPDLFNVVDKDHRIYQAEPGSEVRPYVPALPLRAQRAVEPRDNFNRNRPPIARFLNEPALLEEQHQGALESYGAPSVLINEQYVILHVSETAGRYLQQPKGPISGDLLTIVRPELQFELRSALLRAFEKGKATMSRPVLVPFNGHKSWVTVSVRPQFEGTALERSGERQGLVLFIEDETTEVEDPEKASAAPGTQAGHEQVIAQLQAEIKHLREQLRITIEESESSSEQMKAANEELQSINEEYRSATEELETSKEELQSVNEELQTLNSEVRNKLEEVSRAHRDLENLMGANEIATLFLDREMRIQRFTAGVQHLFSMLQVDRGRRISDITNRLGYSEFVEDAERALQELVTVEREIHTPEGNWFIVRLRPYQTVDDRIEGVVITFVDINELKATEQELIQAKSLLEARVQDRTRELDAANRKISLARDLFSALFSANPIPTVLVGLEDGVFQDVNTEFLNYFRLEREQVVGRNAEQLSVDLGLSAAARAQLSAWVKAEERVKSFETEILHPSGEAKNILTSVQFIDVEDMNALIATFIDITDRVRAEQQIRSLASELTATEQAERHRLSQILHDDLQQRIFAIQIQLSFVRDAYEKNDLQSFPVDFEQLELWLTEAIRVTRQLSVDLSPPILH